MKKLSFIIFSLFLATFTSADTFVHQKSGEVLHGYATSQTEKDKTTVYTEEKGQIQLDLAEWDVTADRNGRNNKVVVISIDDALIYEIETAAFEKTLEETAGQGPLFILLEIDTPGGRLDLARRICSAITGTKNCPVITFIKGGKYGGAISAGAAVAFACDKIYMANNTIIGAATVITLSEKGPQDIKETYGAAVGEKFSSAWQAYLASLAEQNKRPGLLARAMVDKDIEVIEVSGLAGRAFVEPANKKWRQKFVHRWSKKGSLLTLTATEAVNSTVADKITDSRKQLLVDTDAARAEIVMDKQIQRARKELKRALGQVERIRKSVDFKIKQSKHRQPLPKVLKIYREAQREFKSLIRLAKTYPDLNLDVQQLEEELNSIKAAYQQTKIESSRRR
ncbi:MAG: hypothetical protein KAS75_02885 [Planctomycetes bacterium]|nr:hypothetical protein [Planctomycetota bacterium]